MGRLYLAAKPYELGEAAVDIGDVYDGLTAMEQVGREGVQHDVDVHGISRELTCSPPWSSCGRTRTTLTRHSLVLAGDHGRPARRGCPGAAGDTWTAATHRQSRVLLIVDARSRWPSVLEDVCQSPKFSVHKYTTRNHDPEEVADPRHRADAAARVGRHDRLSLSPVSLCRPSRAS